MGEILVHTAQLRVGPDVVGRFRARLLQHAEATLARELGCHKFDIHQERRDRGLFLLIEWYDDEAALQVHRESEHYLSFTRDVKDWVIERHWWFWDRCWVN
jgi:autoinducer 2-degrading protein